MHSSFGFWLLVLLAAVLNAAAQLLIKRNAVNDFSDLQAWLNPWLWSVGLLYVLSFALTAFIYSRLPLTVISPLMTGLIFVVMVTFSIFFLSESLSVLRVLGILAVLIGVGLLAYEAS